ncbi:MAG: DUF2630 family protein, partial [Actinomycetota bacterium]|nr:DUF2630 family protein [Actinomycetota bacterium]
TIQELFEERELIVAREGSHHAEAGNRGRVDQIDHDLRVLWDLRRRKRAVEAVSLRGDYYDRYTVEPGSGDPGR